MDENDTLAPAGTVTDSAVERSPVDRLADILDDPETDTEEHEAHAEDDDSDDAPEGEDEGEASEEDSDDEEGAGKPDGPSGDGRFVEHNARVKLANGETTTVQELVKSLFRQSDYTRKSQENAEARKAIDSEKEWVGQTTQQLRTQLDRMSAMMEAWKPQPPQDKDDFAGWIEYQQREKAFSQWQERLDAEAKQLREQNEAEQAKTIRDRMTRENGMLVEKFPAMADPAKRATFYDEAARALGNYGFSKEEIGAIGDHRLLLVIRDLMRGQRLTAKAPQVAAKVKEKPKMVRGGKRGSDPSADGKRARIERLRETGSRADARRALMDLDL